MCSDRSGTPQRVPGFPIRTSTDRCLVDSSPWLLAATHVLHRLQAPRHPPLALCSLENKDARARYGVLKGLGGRREKRFVRCNSQRPARRAACAVLTEGGAFTPSKRNRGSPGADLDRVPGGSCLETRQLPTTGTERGGRQASDQLGVPLTDVRGSNSLERR